MVDLICQHCGSFLASLPAPRGEVVSLRCPGCERTLEFKVLDPYSTWNVPPGAESPSGSDGRRTDGLGGWSTLFHPGSLPMPREDPETEDPADGGPPAAVAGTIHLGPGTILLKSEPGEPPPPPDLEAFFLIPRKEATPRRIPLTTSRTTFGRSGADVNLGDDAVSGRHFQVEVLGREFFIRDLESRNGTLLNGRSIRCCELRPGDEVLAGRTVLVFQTAARRPSGPAL